jgi:hypothetical protein
MKVIGFLLLHVAMTFLLLYGYCVGRDEFNRQMAELFGP